MLSKLQRNTFDVFLHMIENRQFYLLSSHERAMGKTFIVNKLAFTLQTLGYRVFILSPVVIIEYLAESMIFLDPDDYRGRFTNNSVVIVDEAKFVMMSELLDYCEYRNIPIVGYIDFKVNISFDTNQFEKEYECEWIKN